jgi:hypothetical protein
VPPEKEKERLARWKKRGMKTLKALKALKQ